MAYTPTTWATGDIITAEKLNNIERGIRDSETLNAIVTLTLDTSNPTVPKILTATCSHTCTDIANAYNSGKHISIKVQFAGMPSTQLGSLVACDETGEESSGYTVTFRFNFSPTIQILTGLIDVNNEAALYNQTFENSIITLSPNDNRLPITANELFRYCTDNTIRLYIISTSATYILTSFEQVNGAYTFTFGSEVYTAASGSLYPQKNN